MQTAPSTASLNHYPPEELHVARGILIAVALHFFVAALICIILYLMGIVSLRELMEKGGALASSGPAPEPQMTIVLSLDNIQPPPTDQIEFIKQILKIKPPPVVLPKPPEPKPAPKPTPRPIAKTKPHFTAPKATGSGNSSSVSSGIAGTSGLPHPPYPYDALQAGEGGTVVMHIIFDSGGAISSAEITSSSGVSILDVSTRNFVYGHWKNGALANQSYNVPFIYDPSSRTVH
jgi:TonB family protein